MSAAGNRILLQIMKHREQARSVRDGSKRDGHAARPFSAASLYDIGSPLRVSEPSSATGKRAGDESQFQRQRPHTSMAVSPSRSDDDRGNRPHNDAGASGAVAETPTSATTMSRRPPSPYRRAPMSDDPAELKRWIAQLQSRLVAVEAQLQQSNGQRRLLANKLRKYRLNKGVPCSSSSDDEEAPQLHTEAPQPASDLGEAQSTEAIVDAPIDDWGNHQRLIEISEQASTASAGTGRCGQATDELDPVGALILKALGSDAAEQYAFAADVRSDEGLRALLTTACERVVTLESRMEAQKKRIDSQLRAGLAASQRRDAARPTKALLDNLKKESLMLWHAVSSTIEGATKAGQFLHQNLHGTLEALSLVVRELHAIKSMVLGRNPIPDCSAPPVDALSIERLGACIDTGLGCVQDFCKRAGLSSAAAASCLINLVLSPSNTLESLATVPALVLTVGDRGDGHNSLVNSKLPSDDNSSHLPRAVSRTLTMILAESEAALRGLGLTFSSLANHAALLQHCELRSSLTQEELLLLYRQEMEDVKRRCRTMTMDTESQTDAPKISTPVPSDTVAISVPTTSTATAPNSRPGSGQSHQRPSSNKSRRPSAVRESPPVVVLPAILRHLITCVNTLHLTFSELTFGPLHCNSEFQSLAALQKASEERILMQHTLSGTLSQLEGSTLDSIVVHDHKGRSQSRSGSEWMQEPAKREQLEQHLRCLPSTYGELIMRHRRLHEVEVLPSLLTKQDEDDLATHIEMAQRLVEIGVVWHQALGHEVRVHHCSSFLNLVRASKPMQAAYFFHDVSLAEDEMHTMQDGATSFAAALRGVIWPSADADSSLLRARHGSSSNALQQSSATEIVRRLRLLGDASRGRAAFNWKALLLLYKHERMKQLLLTAAQQNGAPQPDPVSRGHKLRQVITAFYADMSLKLASERHLLRSSLRITVDAIWTELMKLLRESASLCFTSGLNLDLLEMKGPNFAHTMVEATRQLADALAFRKGGQPRGRIVTPLPSRISGQPSKDYRPSSSTAGQPPIGSDSPLIDIPDADASAATHMSEWVASRGIGVDSCESSLTAAQLLTSSVARPQQRGGLSTVSSANAWLGIPISHADDAVVDAQHQRARQRTPAKSAQRGLLPPAAKHRHVVEKTASESIPFPDVVVGCNKIQHAMPKSAYLLSSVLTDGNPWFSKEHL